MTQSGTRNKGTSVKQGGQEWGKKAMQEDHGDIGMDINETGNTGMKDETVVKSHKQTGSLCPDCWDRTGDNNN